MTVSFRRFLPDSGLSAFHDGRIRMSFGSPIVECSITVRELQSFVCTLEQAIEEEPSFAQRQGLQHIASVFKASLELNQRQHEELVKEAPRGADFEEYMVSYANAIQQGAL
jgi:DNA-directed RNA polymerase subunit F